MKKLSLVLALTMILSLFAVFTISAEEVTVSVWDGVIPEADTAYAFGGGDGTEDNPYLLSSAADLAMLNAIAATGETFEGYYFFLTVDITMNEGYENAANWGTTPPANNWTGIAPFYGNGLKLTSGFRGHINGGGHVIRGLYSKIDDEGHAYAAGLFGVLYGSVKNLGFENCYVEHNTTAGIGAGILATAVGHKNLNSAEIENCYAVNSTVKSWRWAGLICGVAQQADVVNCYTQGEVYLGRTDDEADGGGIVGYLGMGGGMATIEDSYTLATINEAGITGPITGLADAVSTVANCYYDSTITTINKTWVHNDAKSFYEIIDLSKDDMTVSNMDLDTEVWEDSDNGPILTVFKNPMSEPPVTEAPPATEPPATQPVVTEPVITEPTVTEPTDTEPVTTEPTVTEPAATEPAVSEPAAEPASAPIGLIIGIVAAVVVVVVIVIVIASKKKAK